MKTIKIHKIILERQVSENYVKKYGGVKNYKELLHNLLDRYDSEEYYDPDLLEEINRGENIW